MHAPFVRLLGLDTLVARSFLEGPAGAARWPALSRFEAVAEKICRHEWRHGTLETCATSWPGYFSFVFLATLLTSPLLHGSIPRPPVPG